MVAKAVFLFFALNCEMSAAFLGTHVPQQTHRSIGSMRDTNICVAHDKRASWSKLRCQSESVSEAKVSRRMFFPTIISPLVVGLAASQYPSDAVAEVYEYTNYNQDGGLEAVFRLDLPQNFFKSKRPLRTGTIFVAGSLLTAEIVSVEILSIEQILADIGVIPTGDFSSWQAIGNPKKVADLLAAIRDGDAKQQGGLPSKVDPNSVEVKGNTLSFLCVTPIAVQRPDKLMETQGISELRRITQARAELRGDKKILVLWASALEQDWKAGAASVLGSVANSLVLAGPAAVGLAGTASAGK